MYFKKDNTSGNWEAGGGWFLHPQSNDDVSGKLDAPSTSTSTSYVGFSMDDEIMAAIRNELLEKLPHAQVTFDINCIKCNCNILYLCFLYYIDVHQVKSCQKLYIFTVH